MEKIGIPELDKLSGGFFDQSLVLISGPPGSPVSLWALQMALAQTPALYIILEENKQNFLKFYNQQPWNVAERIKSGDIVLVDYPANEANQFFEQHGSLVELVNAVEAERIVVDSLTAIAALFERGKTFMGLLRFLETLRKFGKTSIITSVGYSYPYAHTPFGFERLADVWFHIEGPTLQILKFKGRWDLAGQSLKFRIGPSGIEIL